MPAHRVLAPSLHGHEDRTPAHSTCRTHACTAHRSSVPTARRCRPPPKTRRPTVERASAAAAPAPAQHRCAHCPALPTARPPAARTERSSGEHAHRCLPTAQRRALGHAATRRRPLVGGAVVGEAVGVAGLGVGHHVEARAERGHCLTFGADACRGTTKHGLAGGVDGGRVRQQRQLLPTPQQQSAARVRVCVLARVCAVCAIWRCRGGVCGRVGRETGAAD